MLLTEGPDSAFRTPHSALVIGTRGSPLALWQANHVADRLRAVYSDLTVRLEAIKTTGDKILDVPLAKVGGKALFVKEIEEALLERRVDLAVHSMKDVPTELPQGLTIAAVSQREDPHDVLITRTGARFKDLPSHARVGTSSLRRQAQLLHHRPDLQIVGLRGNLDTRIRKLATEGLDAIVVAAAGVKRLGLMDRISQFLPPDISLPAIGQGALGIEIRQGDPTATAKVMIVDHPDTRVAVMAERAFLRRLGGGCQVPFAAHARILNDQVILRGLVATPDGKQMINGERQGSRTEGEAVGTALAEDLLSRGAGEIIRALLPAP
ncbi:MAG TPA: hydroxymethylbilane synthase [Candidatus Methylomirabilis sp.]|nr:hydroxymethylbilane synthase [Candidatus Methylomirabilis sp.]